MREWRVRNEGAAQEFLKASSLQFKGMYVNSSASEVYHLPDASSDATLCGLRLAPVIINWPVNTATLHLTESEPTDKSLCEECAEVDAARSS